MRTIPFEHRWANQRLAPTLPRTSGVYGLCLPSDQRVRYVGSSICIERRMYEHLHTIAETPVSKWMQYLKVMQLRPCALLLQEGEFGLHQSPERTSAEKSWIEHFHLLGQADLNVHMTPSDHPRGHRVSTVPARYQIGALKRRVLDLEAEVARLKALQERTP